jgi:hypothetical protein
MVIKTTSLFGQKLFLSPHKLSATKVMEGGKLPSPFLLLNLPLVFTYSSSFDAIFY